MWILFFVDRMNSAAILAVAMCMVHLCFARLQKAPTQFGDPIGGAHVQVESIKLMRDALARLSEIEFIIFDFIRRPDEQFKIFRHLTLNRDSQVYIHAFLYGAGVEILSKFVSADICVYH